MLPYPYTSEAAVSKNFKKQKTNPHLVRARDGVIDFQSDKYPTCPVGKVPLSTKDPMAQDLLAEYARRRRQVDEEFSDALELALKRRGVMTPGRYWNISGTQSRMARAALRMSMREVASEIGKSHQTIKLFEAGSQKITIQVQHALEDLYRSRYVYFGPKDGVSYRGNGFERDMWLGLWQLLADAGIRPSSREIREAAMRAEINGNEL